MLKHLMRDIAIVSCAVAAVFLTAGARGERSNEVTPPAQETAYTAEKSASSAAMERENPSEEMLIEQALLAKANKIEGCIVTHYCAERYEHICGWGLGITATGEECAPGKMVAVDPSVIPLGSQVMVDYGDGIIHYYFASDVGGAIKGNHIDVMMETHEAAKQAGKVTATVYWIEAEPNG